jgi:hypothetical protein
LFSYGIASLSSSAPLISVSVHIETICSRIPIQTCLSQRGQNTRRCGGTLFCERGQGLAHPAVQQLMQFVDAGLPHTALPLKRTPGTPEKRFIYDH